MSDLLLGIDLGTSSVKALLVDLQGQIQGRGSAAYPILQPRPGFAEQDPTAWWQAVVDAVRQACNAAPIQPGVGHSVCAIGLSGQMHGLLCLDAEQRPLAPAIIWPDRRSAEQVQSLTTAIGRERLVEIAGSPLATGFLAASVRWLQQQRPDLWPQVRTLLLPKDEIRRRLTGQLAADPSDAAGALLLDVRRRDWSPALLKALDVADTLLPPIRPSSQVAGALTAAAADALGLAPGIPVVTGAADTACSALGAGAVSPGALLLTISTGGQLLLPLAEPRVDPQGRIHTFCSAFEPADGPGWYQMGAFLAAGLAMNWLRDSILHLQGEDAYAQMTGWAAATPPGADGLLFLPYLAGERSPHMDPAARGLFLGLTLGHGQGQLVRAVMEGVVLAAYDAFGVLQELGAAPAHVILAGGGAQSRLWRQITADLFGLPVLPLAAAEQSSLGAALLAGAGVGCFRLADAAAAWARYDTPVEPQPANAPVYAELVQLFRAAYGANAVAMHTLDRLERTADRANTPEDAT